MTKYATDFWRRQAAPQVAAVIAAHPEASDSTLRMKLREACPLSQWAIKDAIASWNAEVEAQMEARRGTRKREPAATPGELFGE